MDDKQRQKLIRVVETVLRELRASKKRLCAVQLAESNQGLKASISFNVLRYPAGGSLMPEAGTIEFAFRRCMLTLQSRTKRHDLLLAEDVANLALALKQAKSISENDARLDRSDIHFGGALGASADASIDVPLAKGSAKASSKASARKKLIRKKVTKSAFRYRVPVAGMEQEMIGAGDFALRFTAVTGSDLVELNPHLREFPVITCSPNLSSDAALPKADEMTVSVEADISGVNDHSLRIRDGSGIWNELFVNRRKREVATILFHRFLKPLHEREEIWPPK